MTVISGTVAEVLAWVGEDPTRAREALDAEYASATPRSTLISQLEAITNAEEATPVTETNTGYDEDTGLAPGPEPPEVALDLVDDDTHQIPTVLAHSGVEYEQPVDDEGRAVLPEGGTVVEMLGGAVAPHGFVLVINGEGFIFSPQLTASLQMVVNRAMAGVSV